MKNPATQNQNKYNKFTNVLKKSDGNISVRLRNGDVVQPTLHYVPAGGFGFAEEFFEVVAIEDNAGYRWNLGGSGMICNTFDMMEIVT
jgi:hypothetical protein